MDRDRDLMILWARCLLATQPFVVLDTETTGVDYGDVAVQIGVVDHQKDVLFDFYVNPHKPIPASATAIHGIDDELVRDAPSILDLESHLREMLIGQPVLIYNADYDMRILRDSLIRSGAPTVTNYGQPFLPDDHWLTLLDPIDVMEPFAAFYGEWNDYHHSYTWQKLTVAARHFGIDTSDAHGAVADALMTLGVVEGMAAERTSRERNDREKM